MFFADSGVWIYSRSRNQLFVRCIIVDASNVATWPPGTKIPDNVTFGYLIVGFRFISVDLILPKPSWFFSLLEKQ